MGSAPARAIVDLPDPDEPISSGSAASADDLLAQLAGEEIDRLLAESEDPPSADVNVLPPSDSIKGPGVMISPAESSDEDGLDALLDEAQSPKKIDEPATPITGGATPSVVESIAVDEATKRPTIADFGGSSIAEMTGLLQDSPEIDTGVTPMYVRILEVLNSPLHHLPDAVREALGKVAILTLFNSIAVLAYVFLFRRHQ